jgi:hypothetical protein
MKKTWHYLLTVPIIIGLATFFSACGGGGGGGIPGGGGVPGGVGENSNPTIITGRVVDGYVAGATVTAYQVNADGTKGAQIGAPVTTDQLGNFSLNLGTYTGPVYLTSQGGTYIDAATGNTINLANSPLILCAIVPNASGNVTVEINPLTTMAANVALILISQGSDVATAATGANAVISNYLGLSSNILSTALLDLTTANCMQGASQQSADVSAILAGISQLAKNYGISPPDLIAALVQDVMSDGLFDGLASGAIISVASSGTGQIPLSTIEGPPPGLTGLANAITTFMNTASSNVCGATVDPGVISALSSANIFTPPPTPTGVQATSKYGAARVSWNTVTLATSYNIYMAQSTGVTPTSTQLPGFMIIRNVTSPSVISMGLASATYYIVVTAVSGISPLAGYESAPSAEASTTVTANTQLARTLAAGSNQSSFSSVSAIAGSVYAAGSIAGTGTYDFGNGQTATGTFGGYNSALVKYDSAGVAQWARTVTAGSDQSSFESVAAAPDGSAVYAAGYVTGTGTYNFGNNVTATGAFRGTFDSNNLVLVKYDSAGTAQWAKTVTGTGINYSVFNSVAVALDGSVYAAGYIGAGTYSFGNSVTATGMNTGFNIILVKYDSSGNALWAKTVTAGNNYSYFYSVAAAPDGSVYAAGFIAGSGLYGFGNSITAQGASSLSNNVVLVKYDSSGNAQWARTVTAGSDESIFYSVAAASDGSVYAAGSVTGTGTYNFGNSKAVNGEITGDNLVLVKYDSSGTAQWAQTVTRGGGLSRFYGVSAAPDGSVYASGYISGTGTYSFGNGVIAAGTSSSSLVLVKYDSTGPAQWAQTVVGGNNDSIFYGVSVAADNTVYGAGSISGTGTYNFGNSVTAAGTAPGDNTVLVKYNGFGALSLSWL